ncbi:ENHANCER OF AG-4 protein 2-like [Bidens hawaiensis]|uniref:ENHANCER OF AG-4 protein 2-like n=1 Tax=Bidens hawaiensis TaxID=980011 RepID=UPI004049A543
MAPGRKRGGAKGADANNRLNLGDLVLAKVKGFPAWPAKISNPEACERIPDPKKYFVKFFGTQEIAFVAPVDIQPFTSESRDKLRTRCKGKTVRYFSEAVNEICARFQEFENKSSDSLQDGNAGQPSQLDASLIETVDDRMITDGSSCGTSSNDIVNHGPVLEQCSQREMGYEDVNLSSPLVNDRSPALSTKKRAEFCNDAIASPKMDSISTSGTGHSTSSKLGANVERNEQKSNKIAKALKDNHDVVNKVFSPASTGSAFQTSHIESSIPKNSKGETKRSISHVSKNDVTVGVANHESGDNIRKTKKILTDDLSKGDEGTGREHLKDNVLNNGIMHSAKKFKLSDDVPKKSHIFRKNDVSSEGGNEEVKKATPNLNTKKRLVIKGQTNGSDYGSGVTGDKDVIQPTKRRRMVLEGMSEDGTTESSVTPKKGETTDSVKSRPQVHMKRRAVRIFDEDEDEPKTPMHGRSPKVVEKVLHNSVYVEEVAVSTEAIQDSPGVRKSVHVKESVPKFEQGIAEVVEGKLLHTPGKAESEKKSSEEILKMLVSPVKSPFDAYNQRVEPQPSKVNKTLGKVSGNSSQKKGQSASVKPSNGSQKNLVNERVRPVISGEKQNTTTKTTPKSSSRVADSATVLRKPSDIKTLSSERSEFQPVQTTSLSGSKNADSNKSMRQLIAVAQAKRKQALLHNLVHENVNFSHTEATGKSPGSISAVQPITPGLGIVAQTDDQSDPAEFVERRASSGHHPAGGSLSGGTEAAVARDAFEGMIETLSRTKESIGRATRHAIDCAKHGIANEVVELLTRKLENESSFHRRVDLFFLVDSITQCSHSQKGIAGASYIPNVQAALPRLLGAAAPPGANARENRRQCLKVLKLWLERKILPETLLRSYIEDIGSSNNNTSAAIISKRPSRLERAVDDPIREMEGMLVDEYGSNATFQLPGLLSSNVFEEEDEDGILNLSHKESTCKSTLDPNIATVEIETCSVTSNERRHCILEDVDGELEMEDDVSGHPKDESLLKGGGSYNAVQEDEGSNKTMDTSSSFSNEVSPYREGSPPLPPGSPPPTPPLPSSPPPPLSPLMVPPPPSTPSSPPPPPPPLNPSQTYPIHAGPPQVSFSQPSMPPMSSNVSLNSHPGSHFESVVKPEMFHQQLSREPSGYSSARTVEYRHEIYKNPHGSQSNQQYQTGNVPMPPRTLQTPIPNQTAAGHHQYSNPAMMQHPYPRLYGPTKPPGGSRRQPSSEFSTDSQRGAWMGNGRTSLSVGPPFAPEGYFRSPMERPPTNNSFQTVGQNIVSAGAPVPGRGGSHMKRSLNAWRPGDRLKW